MQAGNSTDHPKKALRQAVRRRLREHPPGDGATIRAAVAAWLRTRPHLRTVASYAAMPGEVDLLPLLAAFPERRWVLPRVVGDDLVWHEVRAPERDLAPAAFGIREPLADLPLVTAGEVDLWLCPGLAFDGRGGRLGKGRGYYDRALAAARPDAPRVGVCHPQQRVADVLAQPHDVPMTVVIDG
jgi:5-formyltetrahydrofolate cyclo-ligase